MSLQADVVVTVGDFSEQVGLEVGDGEVVAVLGPNGSGKSTLLRALAGIQPLHAGRIELDGVALDDPATGTLVPPEHRPCGVVFQDYLLFPHLNAQANVAFGLRNRGATKAEAASRALEWLGRMGVAEQAFMKPGRLSGGQAQRVALARALAIGPAPPAAGRADGRTRRGPARIGAPRAPRAPEGVRRIVRAGHPRPAGRRSPRRPTGHRRARGSGPGRAPSGPSPLGPEPGMWPSWLDSISCGEGPAAPD